MKEDYNSNESERFLYIFMLHTCRLLDQKNKIHCQKYGNDMKL